MSGQGHAAERRIVGPPGTGKTTTLARQVVHDVERYGADGVLITSLTRAAATEIAGRDLPIEPHRVGTLHAHCYRALGRPPLTEDHLGEWSQYAPEYALTGNGRAGADEPDWDRGEQPEQGAPGELLLAGLDLVRARMTPRELWPQDVSDFEQRWQAWKRETGYLDFTDLIEVALLDTEEAPGAPAVLIADETQDYSALEMALCRRWAQRCERFYASGDPDQSIFSWRGADPNVFRTPTLPPDQTKVLAQSFRIPRAVHERALAWIERIVDREPVTYRPRDADGLVRRLPAATWQRPAALVRDVAEQVDQGREVMILASCSYLLAPTIRLLRQQGLAYHNPYQLKRGDWNPLRPSGTGRSSRAAVATIDRLLAFLRPAMEAWGEQARMWNPEDLRRWTALVRTEGVLRRGARDRIQADGGREELGWDTLTELFEEAALSPLFDLDLDWLERSALAARAKTLQFPLAIARERGVAALREQPRVVVGTIHSTKGGESPVVYVLPDVSQAGYTEWLSPGERRDAVVRLFYVAVTRAREELVICGAGGRNAVPL